MFNVIKRILRPRREKSKANIEPPKQDNVNNPAHYTQGEIECIDAIKASMSSEEFRGFLRGNMFKYNWRCNYKGGAEDIKKLIWYAQRLLKEMEGQ